MPNKTVAKTQYKTALQAHVGDRPYGDIASAVGVCKSLVSRVLSGNRCPSLEVAERMARVLGLSLDRFAEMRRVSLENGHGATSS